MSFFVYVFDVCKCVIENADVEGRMLNSNIWHDLNEIEKQVEADGYTVVSQDGDGLRTFVEFDNEADAIMFKLKYGL